MKKKATKISVDGKYELVEPTGDKLFTLTELQKIMGGYIQLVYINDGWYKGKVMVVDEEGLCKPDPQLNEEASKIAGQPIVGNVVIISQNQID